jgi:NosR/NirI family transcriptional regulator, nitrous oxide reductase regulator
VMGADTVETWSEVLGPQALDLALLSGFIALALVSFFRKSVRLKYVTFAVAVVYMGFMKSHLVSIVDIFGAIDRSLPVFKYNLAWYLFSGFTVVSTVLWGRVYCGRICAFGSLTQLLDAVVPAKLRVEVPAPIERRAAWVKYGLLVSLVLYFIVTRDLLVYRYVEPFWMFGLFGTTAMWVGVAVLLMATVFVRNLYCRFLCPVGAALGLVSQVTTVFSIKRWSECKTCKLCEKTCEWGAIRGPVIVKRECVRCDDCERLYLDQKKCPHWLIIVRRSAAQAARSAPSGGTIPAPRLPM